ncbi:MAG: cysteine desulfurase family protein [Gemmatimonadetes bacterium]|nr:cysteine desulfurase family protein [Gemmatimonadota bacterium]
MDNQETIYADYQATTPVDPQVLAKMAPCWSESFGNPHSSDHVVGWRANTAVEEAASSVAALIGADADEVIFTSGATEANNLALFGLARRAPRGRRRILVSAIEHKCVLGAARALSEREGFTVEVIPVDGEGVVDFDALEKRLDESVLLFSVMAVNNEVGTIQDIPRIAKLLAPHGILFHCDAAQAPCAMDVSDLATHADLISLSGHKMYGPQGIGALYLRRDLKESLEPLIYGGGQQEGLRSGTVPMPLCVGMAAAAEIVADDKAEEERKRVACQRDTFIRLLQGGDFPININGMVGEQRHPGNANICFDGFQAEDILGVLQPRLAASTGAACASGIPEPSHVLRALGLTTAQSDASIRFSFGRFTSFEDIESASHLLGEALATLSLETESRPR